MEYTRSTPEQENAYLQAINYPRVQLQADTRTLREWLNDQAHLPSSKTKESDHFLRNFLIGCKGSLEKAKKKLDNYYTYRSSGCSFYKEYDALSKEMEEFKKGGLVGFLPDSLNDGTRVFYFKGEKHLSHKRYVHFFASCLMALEFELRRPDISPMSLMILMDGKDTKPEEFVKINPIFLRDYHYIIQEIMPIRIKKMIYINIMAAAIPIINYVIKPVLSKKINERLVVYSKGEEYLPEYIPNEILPRDIGGDGLSRLTISAKLYKAFEDKRDWFVQELSETTDESKRPPNSKKTDFSFFGVDGSFKVLQLD